MENVKNSKRLKIGFIGAIVSMILLYAVSSAPIPLYNDYLILLGLFKADLSMTAVVYFIGTVISLLLFGEVSNYIGRRKTIILTISVSLLSCINFMLINSFFMLLLGRLLMGLSCGLASSCVAAYMVDTTPEGSTKLAAIVTSGSTVIGLTLGSFASATLIFLNPGSLTLIYMILIVLLIISIILIILGSETIKSKKGVFSSIKPKVKIPKTVRRLFVPASAIFISTWALGGFYQAFSSTISISQFGISNAILAAGIFSSLMAPQILGNTLIKKFDIFNAQKWSMVLYTLIVFGLIISLQYKLVIIFLVLSILAAISIGIAFASSMQTILEKINQEQRAGVLSAIYLISYGGTAIPNFIVAQIGNNFSIIEILIGYFVLILIATLIVIFTVKKE